MVNLFSGKTHIYKKGAKTGEYDESPLPEEYKEAVLPLRPAADRGCRLQRRHPARALSGRRGNPAGGSTRRTEAGDAAGEIVPLFF